MIVYSITNSVNGKIYVGQHIGDDLAKYWHTSYVQRIRLRLRGRPHLFRAIQKHGIENFIPKVLVRVGTKEELDYYEKAIIAKWETRSPRGYNLTDGGGGGQLGFKSSAETREKKRLAAIGRKHTDEWKKSMSERMRGNTYGTASRGKKRRAHTTEECAAISRNLMGNKRRLGIPHDDETKRKIGRSLREYWAKNKTGKVS